MKNKKKMRKTEEERRKIPVAVSIMIGSTLWGGEEPGKTQVIPLDITQI